MQCKGNMKEKGGMKEMYKEMKGDEGDLKQIQRKYEGNGESMCPDLPAADMQGVLSGGGRCK